MQSNRWKRDNLQNYIKSGEADLNALEMGDCDEYYPVVDAEPIRTLEDRLCDRVVQLSGPKSPLESEMYSTLVNNQKRSIHIDPHSVNSVLLTPLQQVQI